ncbi:MAG: 30S ribosomal protein S2 [Candidatus Hodgkinia cicadicola]
MTLNNNPIYALSPRDIDTFIAFNIHYGFHKSAKANLAQSPQVISLSKDSSVLDVNKTLSSLRLALAVVFDLISKGERILFVRSRTMNCEVMDKFVSKANQTFISKPTGGVLSNWSTFIRVFNRIGELTERVKQLKNRKLKRILVRQLSKRAKYFVGFNRTEVLPKALIVSCDEQVQLIIREANKLKIPVIGFADISASPFGVDFVVPICLPSKSANLFIYRMVFTACSIAKMSQNGGALYPSRHSGLNLSRNCNLHLTLLSSCLFFKQTIVDQCRLHAAHNRRTDLLMSSVIRNLGLKEIFHWVLSESFSASTPLKTIVRFVAISQLRMTGNGINLSCFSRKLIVNLRMVQMLAFAAKRRDFVQSWTETEGFAIPRNAYFTTKS